MSNVITKVKSFLPFLFLTYLLKVSFIQVVLPKLKLNNLKLNEFAAVFDFFSKQAPPSRVTNFHKKNKLFLVNQVKGHITCGSVCYNSISEQYRRKVYYLFSFYFRECVFDWFVASFDHSISFKVIN